MLINNPFTFISPIIPIMNLSRRRYSCPHFAEKETEASRFPVACASGRDRVWEGLLASKPLFSIATPGHWSYQAFCRHCLLFLPLRWSSLLLTPHPISTPFFVTPWLSRFFTIIKEDALTFMPLADYNFSWIPMCSQIPFTSY